MILGKVVRILSAEEVILNIGSKDDVKIGMQFVIYEVSEHITDPETGEDLGALETIKGRVKVTHLMEKMSRAQTIIEEQPTSNPVFDFVSVRTRPVKTYLSVKEGQIKPIREDHTVKEGDKVHSVL